MADIVAPTRCLPAGRRAMTLVELLVVVAILGLLLVTVIPILSPSDDQKGREAAATTAGMVTRVIGRAFDNGDRGAGMWIQPLVTTGTQPLVTTGTGLWYVADPSTGQPLAMAALDLFACEPQDEYLGDDPTQAKVHVNRNARPPSVNGVPIDDRPQFKGMIAGTEAVVTFSAATSPFVRQACVGATRIRIPRDSNNEYFLRLITAGTAQVARRAQYPGFFPRPYRPCNYKFPTDIGPGDPDFADPTVNPSQYYYPGVDPQGPFQDVAICGFLGLIPGGASLPAEPPRYEHNNGGNPHNIPGVDAGESFAIIRPAVRAPTPPLSLPKGYAIDVAWSSCGTTLLRNSLHRVPQPPSLASPVDGTLGMNLLDNFLANQPVELMFDKTGRVVLITYRRILQVAGDPEVVEERLPVLSDVFLLVGRADRVGLPYRANPTDAQPGANWQYPDSRWVKISRSSGRTLVAEPKLRIVNPATGTLVTATTALQSQELARDDIAATRQ